ncbi:hypothetical protein ACIHFE_34220 [Streptomyces sp. NPDC052396]|uniref:hypothetical protein n=1 Tax=Streptomyces sp. NPDC052396 TaxID=3365689 RepID=UPI0037D4A389
MGENVGERCDVVVDDGLPPVIFDALAILARGVGHHGSLPGLIPVPGLLQEPDAAGEGDLGLNREIFGAVAVKGVVWCDAEDRVSEAGVVGAQVAVQARTPTVQSPSRQQEPDLVTVVPFGQGSSQLTHGCDPGFSEVDGDQERAGGRCERLERGGFLANRFDGNPGLSDYSADWRARRFRRRSHQAEP